MTIEKSKITDYSKNISLNCVFSLRTYTFSITRIFSKMTICFFLKSEKKLQELYTLISTPNKMWKSLVFRLFYCIKKNLIFVLCLASQIWDLAEGKTNTMELAEAIDNSDLEAFGFTDDFIFELWGAITGIQTNIIQNIQLFIRITSLKDLKMIMSIYANTFF